MKTMYSARRDKSRDSSNFSHGNGKQKEVQSQSSESSEDSDNSTLILSQKKRKLNDSTSRVTKSMKDILKVRDRDTPTKVERGGSSANKSDNSGELVSKFSKEPGGDLEAMSLIKSPPTICNDIAPGPPAQRMVSASMEEPSHDSYNKPEENNNSLHFEKLILYHTTACLEHHVRRELEAIGLLNPNQSAEIEELRNGIRKCAEEVEEIKQGVEEMKIVGAQNQQFLTELLALSGHGIKRPEIKQTF